VEIYRSARKHGVAEADMLHAIEYALAAGEQDDGKVLYLGPDRTGISSKLSPSCAATARRS